MKKLAILILSLSFILSLTACQTQKASPANKSNTTEVKSDQGTTNTADSTSAASADATSSASIVPNDLIAQYKPKGFTDSDKKKALFVVGDPRKNSVNYDLAYTAMKHFEENGYEVELRDLYDMKFSPVITPEEFYYAKDGTGEPTADVKTEQEFVTKSDEIIFVYPNWHDTPNAITKGYMERVFAKQFAYKSTDKGLEGMLKDKSIFTIMNCGYLGGGRGFIGDGVGISDDVWDQYMKAFKVMDDDTAGFWGVSNKGRFVNDRTPANSSDKYEQELNQLRADLTSYLDKTFF